PFDNHRLSGVEIPWSQFEPERDAPEFPPIVLCTGPHIPGIKFHPETGGFQVFLEFFCGSDHVIVTIPDGDWYNHSLKRGNSRREDQALVIAMNGDQRRDTALRDSVAGLICDLLLP